MDDAGCTGRTCVVGASVGVVVGSHVSPTKVGRTVGFWVGAWLGAALTCFSKHEHPLIPAVW